MTREAQALANAWPAAREIFERLDGRQFANTEEFGAAYSEASTDIGPKPRFYSAEESIDLALLNGTVIIDESGIISIDLGEK